VIVEPIDQSSNSQTSVKMSKDRIKTIGVSLLGSPENDGEFEFAIDEFWAINKVRYLNVTIDVYNYAEQFL
jgi:hypothetical protein